MSETRVFVDFNNKDPDGFLRLNLVGTTEDLSRDHRALEQGMLLTGSDGDLTARIIVVAPGVEGILREGSLMVLGSRGRASRPLLVDCILQMWSTGLGWG